MATTIRLLGSPVIVHDDVVYRVRGKKTWAVLARILLSDRPLPRRQLAAEIFPDADDPMGAVRWSLSQARRALGLATSLVGDPVEPRLASGVVVDVRQPRFGMDDVLEVSGSLLDGVEGRWTPDFDMWLSVERARAEHDDPRCAILGFSGLNLADGGNTSLALERFRDAVERAVAGAQRRPLIFALTVGARSLIDSGDLREAAIWLARAEALIAEERWLSFRPLARCLQHELDLVAGHPTSDLRKEIEETYSHSCQLGDPCWEAAAARMLGLTWARDRPDTAFSWLAEARSKAAAYTDMWAWVTGAVLDSEVTVALAIDDGDRAQAAARQLLDHSTRRQLGGFVDRAVAVLTAG